MLLGNGFFNPLRIDRLVITVYVTGVTRSMQIKQRPRHPNKEIEAALQYAEENEFRVLAPTGKSSHAWGVILCILANRDGCRKYVWSTPRNTHKHARDIKRYVDRCQHKEDAEE